MIDSNKIYKWIKAQINPYGKPFEGTVFEFGCKVMDYIEAMEKQPKTDWIPCEERLPEERLQSVIGWDEYRQRCCLVRYDKEWILGNYDSVKITHWQPLPTQPYKKEGSEHE